MAAATQQHQHHHHSSIYISRERHEQKQQRLLTRSPHSIWLCWQCEIVHTVRCLVCVYMPIVCIQRIESIYSGGRDVIKAYQQRLCRIVRTHTHTHTSNQSQRQLPANVAYVAYECVRVCVCFVCARFCERDDSRAKERFYITQ